MSEAVAEDRLDGAAVDKDEHKPDQDGSDCGTSEKNDGATDQNDDEEGAAERAAEIERASQELHKLMEEDESSADEYEVTTITRTIKKTTYHPKHEEKPVWTEDMNVNKKLYGKDLSEYDNMDVEELLEQLTPEELQILAREVDPDDTLLPPDQRTSYLCEKEATGPLDRKNLIKYINEQAINEPDRPEAVPYEQGVVRGKKWIPPPPPEIEQRADEAIAINLGDEYERVLGDATENELVELAAILGFHSMMNQDQYHASVLGKKVDQEVGWAGITRATRLKVMEPEPPNETDPEDSIARLQKDDADLHRLNLNNVKNVSDEQINRLFEAAEANTRLESLQLSNTGLTDRHAERLIKLLEKNSTLKDVNVESNFISPPMIARLVKALLKNKSVETFRAANQRSQVLGNKIEMEITKYIEQNPNILQLGLSFDFNDARARVASQLQRNRDRFRTGKRSRLSCRLFRDNVWKRVA